MIFTLSQAISYQYYDLNNYYTGLFTFGDGSANNLTILYHYLGIILSPTQFFLQEVQNLLLAENHSSLLSDKWY